MHINSKSKIFTQNWAVSLVYFYGAITSCKNCEIIRGSLWYIQRWIEGQTGRPTD